MAQVYKPWLGALVHHHPLVAAGGVGIHVQGHQFTGLQVQSHVFPIAVQFVAGKQPGPFRHVDGLQQFRIRDGGVQGPFRLGSHPDPLFGEHVIFPLDILGIFRGIGIQQILVFQDLPPGYVQVHAGIHRPVPFRLQDDAEQGRPVHGHFIRKHRLAPGFFPQGIGLFLDQVVQVGLEIGLLQPVHKGHLACRLPVRIILPEQSGMAKSKSGQRQSQRKPQSQRRRRFFQMHGYSSFVSLPFYSTR